MDASLLALLLLAWIAVGLVAALIISQVLDKAFHFPDTIYHFERRHFRAFPRS